RWFFQYRRRRQSSTERSAVAAPSEEARADTRVAQRLPGTRIGKVQRHGAETTGELLQEAFQRPGVRGHQSSANRTLPAQLARSLTQGRAIEYRPHFR